jgi:hypothetical protein
MVAKKRDRVWGKEKNTGDGAKELEKSGKRECVEKEKRYVEIEKISVERYQIY